ncbi:hypothetical protein LZG04_24895 [Saccharothrix sp. S26]|uniref:hypothetical protein n=1 Tax=Saccharothrix sp. S26 TaxID=2907215 RepID=UPI001F3BCAFA|nr:hypothetical protein [Saccharothrix sp. S26]MCE6998011.1 hypothetical protein [Saccharothrix sp. S26]
MRLVFVHGRGQAKKDPDALREHWKAALVAGLGDSRLPEGLDIRFPFYGKLLQDHVDRSLSGAQAVARGAAGTEQDALAGEMLLEIAERAGVTNDDIAKELDDRAVARGPENWPWVRAAARAVGKRLPWLASGVLEAFVRDVHTYLSVRVVAEEVNERVRRELDGGSAVVVSHSLGSIVAYQVLHELGRRVEVPLFVTVGSPLGIPVVKSYLEGKPSKPPNVRRWVNGSDERDPVALYARLDRDSFAAGIDNFADIHNPRDDAHGITGYLSDEVIAAEVLDAVERG